MTFRKTFCIVTFCFLPVALMAQQRTLTNVDVINMTKSGIGEQTIILTIQKGPTKFDTSADALIQLKKQGVSDLVLNAMISASANPAATTGQDCGGLLDKALLQVGPRETLLKIRSIRSTAQETVSGPSGSQVMSLERVTAYPSSVYSSVQSPTVSGKLVITPDFSYLTSGKMITSVPVSTMQELKIGLDLDPIFIAQHREEYSCSQEGNEHVGSLNAQKLGIKGQGVEGFWYVDETTGRLLRTAYSTATDQFTDDFSDWRTIDGVSVPFTRHVVNGVITTDVTISDYQLNPTLDETLFQRPAKQVDAGTTLKILQSESVPYVVQTNGGVSTACNISGSTSTTTTSSTYGNTTYGNATSTPNLQMNCRSSDTTMRWQHVLNAMFVEASDGNAYIIACDRAWRWSKCVPLRAGDTFLARRSDKGFVIQFVKGKSKEEEATYSILQSRALHQ